MECDYIPEEHGYMLEECGYMPDRGYMPDNAVI